MKIKHTFFLAAMACLFAGCASDSKPVFKAVIQGSERQTPPLKIATEPNLPVVIKTQGNEALPVEVRTAYIAYIAAGIALLSVFFAWWSARNAKLSSEGRLFLELTREYVSNEIGKGIKDIDELLVFKKIEEWQNQINTEVTAEQREKEAKEILKRFGDKSQIISKVAIYFSTILQLYKSGYVSREFARSICEITRITENVEYFMELSIWANGGGNEKVEKFRNELREIRRIEGA